MRARAVQFAALLLAIAAAVAFVTGEGKLDAPPPAPAPLAGSEAAGIAAGCRTPGLRAAACAPVPASRLAVTARGARARSGRDSTATTT